MKKKWLIPCFIAVFAFISIFYAAIQKTHTFTLLAKEGTNIRSEEIQPLFGTVSVSSDCDTNIIFTDVETGETYTIGYIDSGSSEKIKLPKGRWYTIEGVGNLTLSPVNIRIQ